MLDWLFRKASSDDKDFISLSSHELRTPLSVIKWYTEMLLDEDAGPLTEDQRKYLKTIESSNQQAIDLVRSLLNVSRLDLGTFCIKPSKVELSALTEEILTTLEDMRASKNLSIVKEWGDLPTLTTDRKMCEVAIKNLIANAYLYSHKDGEVTITIKKLSPSDSRNDLYKDAVLISVTDHGIGIPQEEQGQVFQKMYKGSNSKDTDSKGSGLGLYIARSIATHLRGDLSFSSKEGTTEFRLLLPLEPARAKEGRTTLD